METIVMSALLSAVSGILAKAIPAWVASHPKTALTALAVYVLMEHLWPILAARGWVKGNSTLTVALNACVFLAGAFSKTFTSGFKKKG